MRDVAEGSISRLRSALLTTLLTTLILGCGSSGGEAEAPAAPPAFPTIGLSLVASGFAEPVQVTHAGDGSDRLFVVERRGVVRIVQGGAGGSVVLATPFLDLTPQVQSTGGEQGLLAIAFPPGFGTLATRRHFYVHYTARTGIGDSVLARYQLGTDANRADPASGSVLLTVAQPFENHNGGQLTFGPDGLLYLGLGDGGAGGDPFGHAQNPASLLGKILRLDVEGASPYAIPPGNPFGNEVWALGLRNPWRFSFDRATGELYIGDVGQDLFEEIDVQAAASPGGENYGWAAMEGRHCFAAATCDSRGLTLPVAEYAHGNGDCSVTGGFVYRGTAFPSLRGIYLYADVCSGRIWGLRRSGAGWENQLLLDTTLAIASFGEDEAGELYVADLSGGAVHRVEVR